MQLWVQYGVEDFQVVKSQVVADLVDRLTEGIPSEIRSTLEAAATLRWFNKEILRAVTNLADVNTAYIELRRFPSVRPRKGGFALHDVVRELIDENLHIEDPERYHKLHEQAVAYFEGQLTRVTGEDADRLGLERLYHYLCIDEVKGTQILIEMGEELANAHFVERLRQLLSDVKNFRFAREGSRLWVDYFEARLLQLQAKGRVAEQAYERVAYNLQASPRLRAYALCDLGNMLARWQKLGEDQGVPRAKQALEQSLNLMPLDTHLVGSLFSSAHLSEYQGKWDESGAYLDQAKQFYQAQQDNYGMAYVYSMFQLMYMHKGELKGVLDSESKARATLSGFPKYSYLTAHSNANAWVWCLAGRYLESEQRARESLTVMRNLGDIRSCLEPMRALGWALALQGKFREANDLCKEHLKIAEMQGNYYIKDKAHGMDHYGMVLIQQRRYADAEAYLYESLRIKQKLREIVWIPRTLALLGFLHEVQQGLDSALDFYHQSLQANVINQQYFKSEALTGICRVKYLRQEWDGVLTLVDEVGKTARQHEFNNHLISLYLIQGHIAWSSLPSPPIRLPDKEEFWGESGVETALYLYQYALIHALRYNRFILDQALRGGGACALPHPIIPHCLERGEEGRKMLVVLRDWWQAGNNDIGIPRSDTISPISEGIPLLEAELIAREREPGDGSQQNTIVEQINAALQ